MKRFFRFVYRLLLVVAIAAVLILLVVLFTEMQTLSTRIDELTARVQRLEETRPRGAAAPSRRAAAGLHPPALQTAGR